MEELSPKVQKAVQAALHQARQWRCPIHWDGKEWQKELDAIAQAAAFEACFYFDEQRGMTLETFVFWQVLTVPSGFPSAGVGLLRFSLRASYKGFR
jgi:hypothetical protein